MRATQSVLPKLGVIIPLTYFRTVKDNQRLVKHNRSCKRNEQLVSSSLSQLQHITTDLASKVFTYSDALFYLEDLNINSFINIK